MARVEWFGDEVFSKYEREVNQRLKRACIFLTGQVKKKISTGYPPASKPGEPPHVRTGELRRSVTWEVDESRHVGRVGTNKDYAGYLERGTNPMEARPYLEITLKENRAVIRRILTGRAI